VTRATDALTPPARIEEGLWTGLFGSAGGGNPSALAAVGEVELNLGRLDAGELRGDGCRVRLVPGAPPDAGRGEFSRIVIEFSGLSWRGVELSSVSLDGRGAALDAARLLERKELRLARLEELRPALFLPAREIEELFPDARPRAVEGGWTAAGKRFGLPWRGRFEAALLPDGSAVRAEWTAFRWAGLPAPARLLRRTRRVYPLAPNPDRPFRIVLSSLKIGPEGVHLR
jgi:hypothetical protein